MNFRTATYYKLRIAKLMAKGEEVNKGLIAKAKRRLRKLSK